VLYLPILVPPKAESLRCPLRLPYFLRPLAFLPLPINRLSFKELWRCLSDFFFFLDATGRSFSFPDRLPLWVRESLVSVGSFTSGPVGGFYPPHRPFPRFPRGDHPAIRSESLFEPPGCRLFLPMIAGGKGSHRVCVHFVDLKSLSFPFSTFTAAFLVYARSKTPLQRF